MGTNRKRKQNVLVVGGAGYIGGAVTDVLMEKSDRYHTRVYDNLLYEESYRKPIDFVFGDITDTKKLKQQLQWADAVIWLAGIVGDGACQLNEPLTVQLNQETVEWLARNYKKRIVFTSTCSVYGAQNNTLLDETSDVAPLSLYASTKVKAEQALAKSDAAIFRLGTLFGVSDSFSRIRMDLVVNFLTARAHFSKEISVFGGEQYRPLLHVRDAAAYLVEALALPPMKKAEVFCVAKENMRIKNLGLILKRRFPKIKVEFLPISFEDARNYQVSVKKAHKAFRFRPKYSVLDGINQIHEVLMTSRIKDFANPRYSNQVFLKNAGL